MRIGTEASSGDLNSAFFRHALAEAFPCKAPDGKYISATTDKEEHWEQKHQYK